MSNALRDEFVRLLTTDSPHRDRRRRDFNQAIFNAEGGWAIWSSTDLGMVMEKFDRAVRNTSSRSCEEVCEMEGHPHG
jgi:hypothetical protein